MMQDLYSLIKAVNTGSESGMTVFMIIKKAGTITRPGFSVFF